VESLKLIAEPRSKPSHQWIYEPAVEILLDHIYTNDLRNDVETGIPVFNICDHLPIYASWRRKMTPV